MELIINNPYRIAGVLSNATIKELERQKGKARAYLRAGKEFKTDYDFDILGSIPRTLELIERTFSNIEQNQDKIDYALFWFLNGNSFDDTAINYLKNGNNEKAIEIWDRVTLNKEITSKNFSSFSNLGTFKLLSQTQTEIKEGIKAKIKLIKSDYFEDFVRVVADETLIINQEKQIEKFIEIVINEFKKTFSHFETLDLFTNSDDFTHKLLIKKFTQEPIHKIEKLIESTKNKRKENKRGAYEFGSSLYMNCKKDLSALKDLLGPNDFKYKMIADNMAKEIMQCGIDYFNEWKDTKNPSEEGLKLLNYAKSIALGSQTVDRVIDHIEGIQEWAETFPIRDELGFITQKLSAFQNLNDTPGNAKSLVVNCKPKLESMKSKLGVTDDFYLKISGAVANNAQGMIISAVNDEQDIFSMCANPADTDSDKIAKIADKRSDGTELSFERILNSLLTDKYTALTNLKAVVRNSLEVSSIIASLDMVPELKSRYYENHRALKSIASQLGISTISPGPVTPTGTSNNDELPSWFLWVVGIIIFIVVINTCN